MNVSLSITWRSALRWLIGVVLIWAALGKLANPQEFFTVLLAYRLPLPAVLLKATAVVLPWLELLSGLLLVANIRTTAALAWAVVLFTVFAFCTGQAWARGLHIECGCVDLRLLGIRHGSRAVEFLDSARFAFLRAVMLGLTAVLLQLLQCSRGLQPVVAASATGGRKTG